MSEPLEIQTRPDPGVPGPATVRFGPVTEEDVLAIAELFKDFHPLNLRPGGESGEGCGGTVLHQSWISGLVSHLIGGQVCGRFVSEIEINHCSEAHVGDVLTLEPRPAVAVFGKAGLGFRVINQRRQVIAVGMVVMEAG